MRVIFRQKRASSESHVCICFSEDSHLCIDPDECGPSPADRSQEMSGSVQQIIDKYSKELNASLRHAGVHAGKHHKYGVCRCAEYTRSRLLCAGAVNSECQSWSSVLHEEVRAHDGDAAQISGQLFSSELQFLTDWLI